MQMFLAVHPLHRRVELPTELLSNSALPEDLRALQRQVGLSSFAGGFFRFVRPESLRPYMALWGLEPARCTPLLLCAFGQMLVYSDGRYLVVNPVHNSVDDLGGGDELDFVMDIALTDRAALEASFLIDLYEQAVGRLGPPAQDELYALVPALRLGGPRDAAHVQRTRAAPQLQLLAQI